MLLYEFIKALKSRHYMLKRQLALVLTRCSGFVSPHCPVCFISRRYPIDHRNANRSLAILARLQFLQYEALDLDSAFREPLHHASAVRAPGQQGGLVRGQTVLHRGASGRSFYSDFRRSARAASRSYSSAIRSMDALACGMTDKPSAIRRISSERMCQ